MKNLNSSSKNYVNQLQGYLRAKAVCTKYSMSNASLWRKSKIGSFPKPVKLSAGITAWRIDDLLAWEKDPLNYKAGV